MRLLRTDLRQRDHEILVTEEFSGDEVPAYAILSHTWEDDEVLLADIEANTATQKKGFRKLRYAADQARRDGFDYIWIDTCCIDKTSSAELSEAINSMYDYYQAAAICYTYLADVPADVDTAANESEFTRSKWFTRGWCLQELLAPRDLVFFSRDWVPVGQKWTLHSLISIITNIDTDILTGDKQLDSVSIAKRMSWAAHRHTTRPEDVAYCLMGIFSVNMPMLYGEGSKAFQRLQEEIMKHSDDQSLFAWVDLSVSGESPHGLLADSPAAFANSANIVQYQDWESSAPFEMSNRGLRIELPLTRCNEDMYAAALNCPVPQGTYDGFLAIYLKKIPTGASQYTRVKCDKLGSIDQRGHLATVFVRQWNPSISNANAIYPDHYFHMYRNPGLTENYKVIDVKHLHLKTTDTKEGTNRVELATYWNRAREWLPRPFDVVIKMRRQTGALTAVVLFRHIKQDECFALLMGCKTDFDVGFCVVDMGTYHSGTTISMTELQNAFVPSDPGTTMVLPYHRVRVSTQPRIVAGAKYYLVDVNVQSIEKEKPLPEIVDPVGSHDYSNETKKSRKPWHKLGRQKD